MNTAAGLIDESSVYTGNTAYYYGGGLYLEGSSASSRAEALLNNTEVSHNNGSTGAGIFLSNFNVLDLSGALVEGNVATSYAGGIYGYNSPEITITSSTFKDNVAGSNGGGLWLEYTYNTTTITDSSFENNSATYGSGGAVFADYYSPVEIQNTDINNNYAYSYGGGIYSYYYSGLDINNTTLSGNTAQYNYGGAVFVQQAYQIVSVNKTTIEDNSAGYFGGGLFIYYDTDLELYNSTVSNNTATYEGGGVMTYTYSAATVYNTVFEDNSTGAGNGGGMSFNPGLPSTYDLTIQSSTFDSNSAYGSGGGLYSLYADDAMLSDNVFTYNKSTATGYAGGGAHLYYTDSVAAVRNVFCANSAYYGGGVYVYYTFGGIGLASWTNNVFQENQGDYAGGGAYFQSDYNTELINNTFVGNEAAAYGGALYLNDQIGLYSGEFTNNVVAYTASGDGIYGDSGSAAALSGDMEYNDWYSNSSVNVSGSLTSSMITGSGNLNVDPKFTSLTLDGDCSNDDLSLASGSSLINAGDTTIKDDDGTRSDIGAYGGLEAPEPKVDDDGDGYNADVDCDDTDASVNPGAAEVAGDEVDQDCDGTEECYADKDDDGYHSGATVSSADLDCDDSGEALSTEPGGDCKDANSTINPGEAEIPYDGKDQDCDGADLTDVDGDGHDAVAAGGDDCDDDDATVNPSEIDTPYDGVDQDCSGADVTDADGDGYDATEAGGDDCDDDNAAANPRR
ncbi:MAG: right-handed parallel beta-helix repeat-containing protein [Deltaproteobacteria bacterium]|nr:right-handed parallel beta-helix repeat-containing protein [Deltaproteobacteria bacterium]